MRNYFCGWYFRCQSDHQTIALIPAYHMTKGVRSCSIQVITEDGSWNAVFPYSAYGQKESGVKIGGNYFGKKGLTLDLNTSDLVVKGSLIFGELTPLRYDIMGPFRYVPLMQCRHSVFSMKHSVGGRLEVNGIPYEFQNGIGYMEGDRGYSFPRKYVWTQCSLPEGSLMLSVAEIPFCGFCFTGVICAIYWRGKEYRMGTYLGARVTKLSEGQIVVTQGRKQLVVRQLEKMGHPLAAPARGSMTRTIHETAACKAYYHYQEDGRTIFECEITNAAFEYEYPR